MNLAAAITEATELQAITQSARQAIDPMSAPLAGTAQAFAGTVPGQIADARQRAAEQEIAMAEAAKKAAEAAQSHEAATTALHQHEHSIARWKAAKINTLVFQKKGALFAVTTKLEEITATLADLEGQASSQPDAVTDLQKQKAALVSEAASLQQVIDTEIARFQAALPK
jgi:chromosome segregation ATPase